MDGDEISPDIQDRAIPILWLLGKTGAGKSSLVRALTGLNSIEIGNGYRPCTRTSERLDYPADHPLVRFLDTRGLGEAGYDPAEDLEFCFGHSHAVLIVSRLDDPVQGEVADALKAAIRKDRKLEVLVVHTGADLLADDRQVQRARHANLKAFEAAAGRDLADVMISLPSRGKVDQSELDELIDGLLDLLPAVGLLLAKQEAASDEQKAFLSVRNRVLFYAGVAGTSDIAPIVGAVSVPLTQFAMLRELGKKYDVEWSRTLMAKFLAALGVGVAARFGGSYGLRQLGKLVPVYGQTFGAALSGSLSFAATYALGRAASMFLHAEATGRRPSKEELQAAYRNALRRASRADR